MLESRCRFCDAPINRKCRCEDCRGGFHRITSDAENLRVFCHVCLELSRIMFRSTYFSNLERAEDERRKRMGL